MTGERTVPVLEAAHIRPNSQEGPHRVKMTIKIRIGAVWPDRRARILLRWPLF
jgi:hypothetical protein